LEDLREKCIYDLTYKSDPQVWWNYIEHVHNQCYNGVTLTCSRAAHSDLGINYFKTKNCLDAYFEDQSYENDSPILREEARAWTEIRSVVQPTLTINGVIYRGDLSPEDVFEAICAGFKNRPSECMKETFSFKGVSPNTVVAVVGFLVVVNIILLLVYRRFHDKEQKEDM